MTHNYETKRLVISVDDDGSVPMTDIDITDRLLYAAINTDSNEVDDCCHAAIDEIERLRAAGDAMAEVFSTVWQACQCYTQDMEDAASVGFKAWQEARNG